MTEENRKRMRTKGENVDEEQMTRGKLRLKERNRKRNR